MKLELTDDPEHSIDLWGFPQLILTDMSVSEKLGACLTRIVTLDRGCLG